MTSTVSETTLTQCDRASFQGSEGIYMLPHHAKEIDRLHRQHIFMSSSTGGELLRTPLPDTGRLRVLDCGAADGTWLRDLKVKYPSWDLQLFGIDIGSVAFPPHEQQKRQGIDLRKHDLCVPFPTEWQWDNSFDIIHQRLLVWGLKSNQWPHIIKNLKRVLKPGGWVQLVEAEWIIPNIPDDRPEQARLALMQRWSTRNFGMDIDIAYKLEDLLSENGYANVNKVVYKLGYGHEALVRQQADPSAELYVESFRSLDMKMGAGKVDHGDPLHSHISDPIHNPEGIPNIAKTPDELHAFLDRLEIEIKTKGYAPLLNYVMGQKPL